MPLPTYLCRVRIILIAALLIAACDGAVGYSDLPAAEALAAGAPTGVDLLALRVPRTGGRGRVLRYPSLDSTLWSSAGSVPSITRVLSFDVEAGSLLYSDSRGIARSLDFRLGAVSPATQLRLTKLSTVDGWNVYGISQSGAVGRSTPSAIWGGAQPAAWNFEPSLPARDVFPLQNGSLLVVGANDSSTMVWRLYPPDKQPTDSLKLEKTGAAFRSPTGDRLYLSLPRAIVGIATKDLKQTSKVRIVGGVTELVPTPSGNQVFIVGDSSNRVYIFDRYDGKIAGSVRFPGKVRTVRMDPLGRFLLAGSFSADTAWIVALSNHNYVRVVETDWRADLPYIAWDGSVVTVRGRDVRFLDPITLAAKKTVAGGASDFWYFFSWNGFRPRAAGMEAAPVNFPGVFVDHNAFELPRQRQVDIDDSVRAAAQAARRADSIARAESAVARPPARSIFTVSFAVLRSDSAATKLARTIRVRGQTARVVEAFIDATPIFRVVLGPYQSREEAESAGRASGVSYWVYPGPP